jgi:pimeloyl-ACP methyl ester carboxylesterase
LTDAVFEGYCEGLSQAAFNTLLTRQLKMTVENEGAMAGDVLEAYLAPHQSALGRASFFEHHVRHYDSKYTEEISGKLGTLTMPVRIVWGEGDQWQPRGYAERLSSDIPDADLVVVPEAGHFVMEDAPGRVAREISDFLTVPASIRAAAAAEARREYARAPARDDWPGACPVTEFG